MILGIAFLYVAQGAIKEVELVRAPDLPIVIVTTEEPSELDKVLPDARARENFERANLKIGTPYSAQRDVEKALARGYRLKTLSKFHILHPDTLFNLRDAGRQTELMERCFDLAKSGVGVVSIADLSAADQKTLRGMVGRSENEEWDSYRRQPDLKFKFGLESTLSLKLGAKEANLLMRPRPPMMSELDSVASSIAPKDKLVEADDQDEVKGVGSTLSIIFPNDCSPIQRLVWTDEIQSYLLRVCEDARAKYKSVSDRLCMLMTKNDPLRYPNSGESDQIRFKNLDGREQHDLFQGFKGADGRMFGDDGLAQSFLQNAETIGVQTNFTMTAFFIKARSATHAGLQPVQVTFRCPIDP